MLIKVLFLAPLAPLCAGHGALMSPFSFHDQSGTRSFYSGCTGKSAPGEIEKAEGCVGEWFTNYTFIPGKPTIAADSDLTAYQSSCGQGAKVCCGHEPTGPYASCDWTSTHPWRAPGTAPIASSCGIDGGNVNGCPAGNPDGSGCAAGGYGHGPDGRSLMDSPRLSTDWTIGGEAEVAWAIVANHGGGYSYRLCPKPARGMDLTEECFQQNPLRFSGDTQQITSRTTGKVLAEVAARRVDQGTFPEGSQWTRNPIPACSGYAGGAGGGACDGTQFPPPADGVFGFLLLPYNIVDRVEVPDLPAGEYVLSFRYDCEQTSQVWNQCANVRLVAPSDRAQKLHNLNKLQHLKATIEHQKMSKVSRAAVAEKAADDPCTSVCANDGICAPCKQCIYSKYGPCAQCYELDADGKACLPGCQDDCWSKAHQKEEEEEEVHLKASNYLRTAEV